jgi:glucose/mannose-6-phosphate isomerase
VEQAGVDVLEIVAQGKSSLARMLSTILVGDFTSVYLSVLRGVDPTPVKTVNYLKDTLKQNGFREKVIGELAKL